MIYCREAVKMVRDSLIPPLNVSTLYQSIGSNETNAELVSFKRVKLFLWQNSVLIDGNRMIDPKGALSALSWLLIRHDVSHQLKSLSQKRNSPTTYLQTTIVAEESRNEVNLGSESIFSGAIKIKLEEEWEIQAKKMN